MDVNYMLVAQKSGNWQESASAQSS
jgi:hypothetical protein